MLPNIDFSLYLMTSKKITRPVGDSDQRMVDFLLADFNQSYEQMRHYDGQILEIIKFIFGTYTTLVGTGFALYQFSVIQKMDFHFAASVALIIGVVIGLLLFFFVLRNRVYFVCVTRYVNEQRSLFLRTKPLGFENISKMHADPTKPSFYNFLSSQILTSYIIAALNALLFSALLYINTTTLSLLWIGVQGLLAFLLQILLGVLYLITKESKSKQGTVLYSSRN